MPTPFGDVRSAVAVAVVLHEGLVLVGRRQRAPLAGFAEFPGGKVLAGESAEAAAVREVREECGINVVLERLLARVPADHSHGRLDVRFYLCRPAAPAAGICASTAPPAPTRTSAGVPASPSAATPPTPLPPFRWLTLEEMARLEFPPANADALRALRSLRRDG